MKKVFVFGCGRSGTTVLSDELSRHPQIQLSGETVRGPGFGQSTIEPFIRTPRVNHPQAARLLSEIDALLPYDWWTQREGLAPEALVYDEYLAELEQRLSGPATSWVGFKIIDNQMVERRTLFAELVERQYHVVYIKRRNSLRQAISGLIASQRGVHNSRNYRVPDERYVIDPKALLTLMRRNLLAIANWDTRLARCGLPVLQVFYEDFLADRRAFFEPIFDFLDVDHVDLPDSDFTKMTPKDLSKIIANYEDLEITAQHLGMEEQLAEA